MSDLIVTYHHYRTIPGYSARPGWCARSGRGFCRRHGIDWVDFVRHGIPASALLDTGDALALALVEWAQKSESQNG